MTPPRGSTVPYNEARYGRSNGFPCDDVVCDNTWNLVEDGMNAWVGRTARPPVARPAQIKAELATYDVARPLRLRRRRQLQRARRLHRPPADRARRRRPGRRRPVPGRGRHLEPPLVRLRHRRRHHRPGRRTRSAASRSATPASGPATTRSSPRTVACPPSPTSTGTTSASRTTTTPPAARTASSGGPDGPEPAVRPRASRSAPAPATCRPGTSSQLGWLDYEITVAGQTRTLELGPHEYNSPKAQAAGRTSCPRRP